MKRKIVLKLAPRMQNCSNLIVKILSYLSVFVGVILVVLGIAFSPVGLIMSFVGILILLFKPVFSDLINYRDEKFKEKEREQKEKNLECTRDYDLLPKISENFYLKYCYERDVCLIEASAADISGFGGKQISFVQEPNNPHDPKAVAIILNDKKIGYIYRGQTQDMLNDWIKKGYPVCGHINKINCFDNKVTYKVGFYYPIDKCENKVFSLVRISKRKDENGNSRADNLSLCSIGDCVEIEDGNIVVADIGEIGELGTSAENFFEDVIDGAGVIEDIIEDMDGNYKAKIRLYKFS